MRTPDPTDATRTPNRTGLDQVLGDEAAADARVGQLHDARGGPLPYPARRPGASAARPGVEQGPPLGAPVAQPGSGQAKFAVDRDAVGVQGRHRRTGQVEGARRETVQPEGFEALADLLDAARDTTEAIAREAS